MTIEEAIVNYKLGHVSLETVMELIKQFAKKAFEDGFDYGLSHKEDVTKTIKMLLNKG